LPSKVDKSIVASGGKRYLPLGSIGTITAANFEAYPKPAKGEKAQLASPEAETDALVVQGIRNQMRYEKQKKELEKKEKRRV
jgi:hypothetical protein